MKPYTDLVSYVKAHLLILEHGEDAEGYARKCMQKFMDVGNEEETCVWLAVLDAVRDLQATSSDDILH